MVSAERSDVVKVTSNIHYTIEGWFMRCSEDLRINPKMQKLAITNASKLRCVEGPHSANTNPIMGDKFQNRNKKN